MLWINVCRYCTSGQLYVRVKVPNWTVISTPQINLFHQMSNFSNVQLLNSHIFEDFAPYFSLTCSANGDKTRRSQSEHRGDFSWYEKITSLKPTFVNDLTCHRQWPKFDLQSLCVFVDLWAGVELFPEQRNCIQRQNSIFEFQNFVPRA